MPPSHQSFWSWETHAPSQPKTEFRNQPAFLSKWVTYPPSPLQASEGREQVG